MSNNNDLQINVGDLFIVSFPGSTYGGIWLVIDVMKRKYGTEGSIEFMYEHGIDRATIHHMKYLIKVGRAKHVKSF